MKVWTSLAAVTLAAASPLAAASVHDHIFGNKFDTITDLPANANEAARFLTQATFGPTSADIAKVMHLGYSEWIDEQLGSAGDPRIRHGRSGENRAYRQHQPERID